MKKYLSLISLVLLLCFVAACQNKEATAELEGYKTQAALEEANYELVVGSEEAWANGDIETLRKILSPDFVWHTPSGEDVSLEETLESVKKNKTMFPDGKYIWADTFIKLNKAAVIYSFRGTHTGDAEGFPATGSIVESSGIGIERIENGKIVEMWSAEDMLDFYQQLGYELKPPEAKK